MGSSFGAASLRRVSKRPAENKWYVLNLDYVRGTSDLGVSWRVARDSTNTGTGFDSLPRQRNGVYASIPCLMAIGQVYGGLGCKYESIGLE